MTDDSVLVEALRRWFDSTATGQLDEEVLTDLGLRGLLIGSRFGGDDGTIADALVVQGELGRSLADTSFLTSAVIASTLLSAVKSDAADSLLKAMAAGEVRAVLLPPAGWNATVPSSDSATSVSFSGPGDDDGTVVLIRSIRLDDELTIQSQECRPEPETVGPTTFSWSATSPVVEIARGEEAGRAVQRGLGAGKLALAADLIGSASRALEITVDYARHRVTFGRPIGSYQAFRHTCAEHWIELQLSRALLRSATEAWVDDADAIDSSHLVTAAAVSTAETARAIGESSILLHGGIGFTWEHEIHRHLKRAIAAIALLGGPTRQWTSVYDGMIAGPETSITAKGTAQ